MNRWYRIMVTATLFFLISCSTDTTVSRLFNSDYKSLKHPDYGSDASRSQLKICKSKNEIEFTEIPGTNNLVCDNACLQRQSIGVEDCMIESGWRSRILIEENQKHIDTNGTIESYYERVTDLELKSALECLEGLRGAGYLNEYTDLRVENTSLAHRYHKKISAVLKSHDFGGTKLSDYQDTVNSQYYVIFDQPGFSQRGLQSRVNRKIENCRSLE